MARFNNPVPQFFNASGEPLSGGKLFFYEVGTTTLKPTFFDSGLTIANQNPVILDQAGRLENVFYSGAARIVLSDANDVQVFERDNVGSTESFSQGQVFTSDTVYTSSDIVTTDGRTFRLISNEVVDVPPTGDPDSVLNWEELISLPVYNPNVIYANLKLVIGGNGKIYRSQTDNNINNEPTTDDGTNWISITNASQSDFNNVISGLAATDVKSAIDELNSNFNSLTQPFTFQGSLDLTTGDAILPSTPANGDTYFINTEGTITVSVDGAAPTPTLVSRGEAIVYNLAQTRWELLPASTQAISVSFNNLATGLDAGNVQDAIDQLNLLVEGNSQAIIDLQNATGGATGGLVYRGQLNVSTGDVALPLDATNGDFYQISGGGTITVSTDNGPTQPTTVSSRDQIVWNQLFSRWDRTPAPPISGVNVELTKILTQPLSLVPLNGTARWYPANPLEFVGIRASVGVAPEGADIIIDIRINDVVVLTLTIPDGQFTSGVVIPVDIGAVIDDYVTVDTTQVGSVTAGSDLTVVFEYMNV